MIRVNMNNFNSNQHFGGLFGVLGLFWGSFPPLMVTPQKCPPPHHIQITAYAHDSLNQVGLNWISAALLTVESLQTSAQSLFELSRQTRINFSTVENSMQVDFINTKCRLLKCQRLDAAKRRDTRFSWVGVNFINFFCALRLCANHRDSSIHLRLAPTPNFCASKKLLKIWE